MKYFKPEEFSCSCGCGGNTINPELVEELDKLRELCGFPFIVTSGFRCRRHNAAIGGHPRSAHCYGSAVDIAARGEKAVKIIAAALVNGVINGIGVSQKGSGRYIHLDISHRTFTFWSY